MKFHTAPEDQGQIVAVSYAAPGDGYVYRMIVDRSLPAADAGRVEYARSKMLRGDEGDYWNGAPKNQRWATISAEDIHTAEDDIANW